MQFQLWVETCSRLCGECAVGYVVGGPWDYTVSSLGQVIVIVISRPRSLTIELKLGGQTAKRCSDWKSCTFAHSLSMWMICWLIYMEFLSQQGSLTLPVWVTTSCKCCPVPSLHTAPGLTCDQEGFMEDDRKGSVTWPLFRPVFSFKEKTDNGVVCVIHGVSCFGGN